jgi:hypothetical protein
VEPDLIFIFQKNHPFSLYLDKTKMTKTRKSAKKAGPKRGADRVSSAYLDKLIDEATVDCYNESEEITGIFTMLEEKLALPFTTTLLGVEVTVERIEMNDADELVAVCQFGRKRQRVSVLDLPLPEPRPGGAGWIEAYRRWVKGGN